MLVALDFESEGIESRPDYPPKPVGLAVYTDNDNVPYYMAWGHPTENNCTKEFAVRKLQSLLTNPANEFIFHNAPFDCSIIEERLGLEVPWEAVHDTMLQAFLLDPFGELSLKPLAELHLGEAPVERDAVRDWLVAAGICRSNDKAWGAHISKAPGGLVGTYAIGDVRKTLNLYKKFKSMIVAAGQPPVPPPLHPSLIGF
jgi:DNA polymerase I-like protein with 3'-5' exonuclease and polymerase domains